MDLSSSKGSRIAVPLLALVALAIGPAAEPANGQYFGRNKVQYETFDFQVLKTQHFDVYYYPEEADAVQTAARMAERWYARLARVFDHELRGRQPLILYANHPDFEQTTALSGAIGEATGGATEPLKRRIVLPMAASLEETDHVLGHELVHAFQFDITTYNNTAIGGGLPNAVGFPLWFMEGMAEYLSTGPVDANTAMWMRDAARRDDVPTLRQLNNPRYFAYRYGQALWAYIGGRWGDQVIGRILKSAGQAGNPVAAMAAVLKISPDSLSADWKKAIEESYQPLVARTKGPEAYGRPIVPSERKGDINIAPALSPDGKRLVFLSSRDRLAIEMYLANVETGEVERKIVKTALDPHWESLQFIYSSGAWSHDGRRFAFAGVREGQPVISILDVDRGEVEKTFNLDETGEIFNPSWSPDGRRIVFSAQAGGKTDLFVLDVQTGDLRRVTDDLYADLEPAWSPDGSRIAFVTDRFTTDLTDLEPGPYRIGLVDLGTGGIEEVPGFKGAKNIDPQWGPNGSLFFVSDVNGISNVYRVDVSTGDLYQITDLLVGVSGITALSPALTVASQTGRLVFSAYEENRYALYVVDSASVLEGQPPLPPLTDVSPAVLPPKDRPVGDVMALLSNPTLGLPDTTSEFETKEYGAGLSLDYIAPPTLVVGADPFGTFVGGGSALFWSDMLGRRTLATLLQVNGSFQDLAALVGYQNQRTRWNWGLVGAQVPYVTLGFLGLRDTTFNGGSAIAEDVIRFRQIDREVSGVIAYPFNRAQRLELTLRYRNITYASDIQTRIYDPFTLQQLSRDTEGLPSCSDAPATFLCDPSALNLANAGAALVYDNAFFGGTSPVLGQRYRFEASPTVGSLNFVSALADYRRYFMPIRPYTLAFRIVHLGRYGADAEDQRLTPLFLGYQPLIRGYESGSFDIRECGPARPSSSFVGPIGCPAFDQLLGSRLLVANMELRFPMLRGLGLPHPAGLPPLELALFFDAGSAWWSASTARQIGGNENPLHPVTSHGLALRANLFGAGVLELDYVHPNQRPGKGWTWEFGFTPGF